MQRLICLNQTINWCICCRQSASTKYMVHLIYIISEHHHSHDHSVFLSILSGRQRRRRRRQQQQQQNNKKQTLIETKCYTRHSNEHITHSSHLNVIFPFLQQTLNFRRLNFFHSTKFILCSTRRSAVKVLFFLFAIVVVATNSGELSNQISYVTTVQKMCRIL